MCGGGGAVEVRVAAAMLWVGYWWTSIYSYLNRVSSEGALGSPVLLSSRNKGRKVTKEGRKVIKERKLSRREERYHGRKGGRIVTKKGRMEGYEERKEGRKVFQGKRERTSCWVNACL